MDAEIGIRERIAQTGGQEQGYHSSLWIMHHVIWSFDEFIQS